MKRYLSFVRFEHTVFALPLIAAGAILATRSLPSARLAGLMLVAAAGARTCAMALNRIIDAGVDARNPRTAGRELPAGRMTHGEAWGVAAGGAVALAVAAGLMSRLCLVLTPVPLIAFVVYPYLKRVTPFAHLGVGLADALGPAGAWVAARSAAGAPVFADADALWFLFAFTALWIAGFDVIYGTQDEVFDRAEGLRSLPAWLGKTAALRVSGGLHFAAAVALGFLYQADLTGPVALFLLFAIVALLFAEHERPDDVQFAFFWANAGVSLLVLGFVLTGVLLPEAG